MEPILLYDTTLRDGTQGENISFSAEEKLMHDRGFAGLEAHRLEHQSFKLAVVEFHRRIAGNEPLAGAQLYEYLHNWISNHILNVDVEYGRALRHQPPPAPKAEH